MTPTTQCVLWIMAALIHFLSSVVLIFWGGLHSQSTVYFRDKYSLKVNFMDMPAVAAWPLACLHFMSFLQILRRFCFGTKTSTQVTTLKTKKTPNTWFARCRTAFAASPFVRHGQLWFGRHGVFGVHGPMYEIRFFMRELCEIPTIMAQWYAVSHLTTDPGAMASWRSSTPSRHSGCLAMQNGGFWYVVMCCLILF